MPRKKEPVRLWLREDTGNWFIKDGAKRVATGCSRGETERAEQALRNYVAEKYEPRRGGSAARVTVGDILIVYLDEKADSTSRPKETEAAIKRLNSFWGNRKANDIRGKTCREFADVRKTESGARRDLEVMRAAINYYHREYGLDVLPAVTLPKKSAPRDGYLTRSQVAALLWACLGFRRGRGGKTERRRDHARPHLARLILIGIYTGTRLGAMLDLQWSKSTTGGYADIDKAVIFRRAQGERVAHNKRKPPVKMARRLAAHMRRWKRLDGWQDDRTGLRYVCHYGGKKLNKPHKAFRTVREIAGFDDDTVLHLLRHTRGTWLAQAQVPPNEAAASLGLTVDEYERTYLHNDPEFQKRAADAY
jgi:integrase